MKSAGSGKGLKVFYFCKTTAFTLIDRHQFSQPGVKLFFLTDFPLMETVTTKGFTLVFFTGSLFFKWQNLGHKSDTLPVSRVNFHPSLLFLALLQILYCNDQELRDKYPNLNNPDNIF